MPFWSSQTLKTKIPAGNLVLPYDESRIVHSAYEMSVGPEAFITSNPSDKTALTPGTKIVIPPGQFGLLVTRETVHIPVDVIAFISIRASIKFQGLVNVSGFHVDPGYHGQLKFAVYNAGSSNLVLDQDQRVFMIWFADLDEPDSDPYPAKVQLQFAITADDVAKIHGEIASPAVLKKQLDELKVEVDKKFHATEHTRLLNRALISLLLGISITLGLSLLRPVLEGRFDRRSAGTTRYTLVKNEDMMRKLVSPTELLRLLNVELAKQDDVDGCQFDGPILRLREPDATGANWSDTVQLRCSGRPAEPSAIAAGRAITRVRSQYNIE